MIFIDLNKYKMVVVIVLVMLFAFSMFINGDWILTKIFPIHYKELIFNYADEYEIDPYLVAAIIKVESKYDEKAISHKNARGLMQIAPITGEWAARELKINNYEENLLFVPSTNIKMGCWYLSQLKKEFKGNLRLILAAYNGGSGNVTKWLKNPDYSSDGINLEQIPFAETRKYVEKVIKYYKIYNIIYE